MRWAYYAISNALIFTPMSANDSPIATLRDPDEEMPVDRIRGIRTFVGAVFFLPGVAILFGFVADVISVLWLQSPFREGHKTVLDALGGDHVSMIRAVGMLFFALVMAILCSYWGSRCKGYQAGNYSVMKRLAEEIDKLDSSSVGKASPQSAPVGAN
jgi:hypothetical protein